MQELSVPFVYVWRMKFCLISLEETTTNLWNRLENLYITNSLTNKIFLKRQLYSLRMKEGTKIVDHLNVFNTLICQLSSMEVKLEDKDKVVTLLCFFPKSWDNLVTSISFNSTYVLYYDSILGALLAKKMRRKSSQETSTSEAMVARGRYTERGQNLRGTSISKSKGKKGKLK